MGFSRSELQGVSWYQLLHWECMREAQSKHRLSEYIIYIIYLHVVLITLIYLLSYIYNTHIHNKHRIQIHRAGGGRPETKSDMYYIT